MITVKGKVGKSYVVQSITASYKSLVVYDNDWKTITRCVPNGTNCVEIYKFDDTFKVRDEIIDLIRNANDEYIYLVVYSNAGKLVNNWLEKLFENMQSEISLKFRDVILFRNE